MPSPWKYLRKLTLSLWLCMTARDCRGAPVVSAIQRRTVVCETLFQVITWLLSLKKLKINQTVTTNTIKTAAIIPPVIILLRKVTTRDFSHHFFTLVLRLKGVDILLFYVQATSMLF